MIRSLFIALGLYAMLIGAECLAVEKALLHAGNDTAANAFAQHLGPRFREVTPPDWAAWSLMSGGAVVMLYSFTLPAKLKS